MIVTTFDRSSLFSDPRLASSVASWMRCGRVSGAEPSLPKASRYGHRVRTSVGSPDGGDGQTSGHHGLTFADPAGTNRVGLLPEVPDMPRFRRPEVSESVRGAGRVHEAWWASSRSVCNARRGVASSDTWSVDCDVEDPAISARPSVTPS